ncbi:hypothetical protein GYMLUDRAFT_58226 [Collybiopsis luxurians FD-317 M1]|uniref:F-box domain-containing protein n=1 Tax=Collybiopsis luxurians FD-317 M1 TaxID=944289 RepID=A0A0D0CSW6_9AGAR|nr:hypothetical protein GYMLUDRAFT_58226 [Collybiopsis luxurians FD-317 M1]
MDSKLQNGLINPLWLPDDIIGLVMEFLSAEDLKQCTLVARIFRHYAQPLLFDFVTVDISLRVLSFNSFTILRCRDLPAFLTSNPDRGFLFKHLKCTATVNDITSLYPVLPYFTQLRSLTLSCGLAPPLFQHMRFQNFPMLKKLVLTDISSIAAVVQSFGLIPREHEWEELSLTVVKNYIENSDDLPPEPIFLPPIRTFRLFDAQGRSPMSISLLLGYLHPMLTNLHRLIASTSGFHSADIIRLIEDNVSTLKSLDTSQVYDTDVLLPRLLKNNIMHDIVLRLPIVPTAVANYLTTLEEIFSDPQCFVSMRQISFVLKSNYSLNELGDHCGLWARLSESLSRFPNLDTVTILLELSEMMDWDWFESMSISANDLDVYPSFESLRKMGRLQVAGKT